MATRSDQQISPGRRPARIARIGRLTGATKLRQYPLDDGRILDARDHLELPAAAPADLDVDGKHPLEALGLRLRDREVFGQSNKNSLGPRAYSPVTLLLPVVRPRLDRRGGAEHACIKVPSPYGC